MGRAGDVCLALFKCLSKRVCLRIGHTPKQPFLLTVRSKKPLTSTFVQDSVGWLVACQRLLAEVLVRLRQALHLGEAGIERHGRVARILGHVQVGRPSQLLLYHQRLLQQLGGGGVRQNERSHEENLWRLIITEMNGCPAALLRIGFVIVFEFFTFH